MFSSKAKYFLLFQEDGIPVIPSFLQGINSWLASAPGELRVPCEKSHAVLFHQNYKKKINSICPGQLLRVCRSMLSHLSLQCSGNTTQRSSSHPALKCTAGASCLFACSRTTVRLSSFKFLLVCTSYTVYNKVNQLHMVLLQSVIFFI